MKEEADDAKIVLTGSELIPGQIVFGKFKIVRCIGSGGMGSVYEAVNVALQKTVALKVLLKQSTDPKTAIRFQNEARMASSLRHDNIASTYDFGKSEDNRLYMSIEFVTGITLEQLIKGQRQLDVIDALAIACQVSAALVHAHAHGVAHRDIKPANIMISQTDAGERIIKVLDFGIAKRFAIDDQGVPTLTPAGQIIGSPLYMSPEQYRQEPVTERTDVYSLGCVLFECLAGRPPYKGATVMETLSLHQEAAIPSLRGICPSEVVVEIDHLIANLLSKTASERYSSIKALEIMEELGDRLETKPVLADVTDSPVAISPALIFRRDKTAGNSTANGYSSPRLLAASSVLVATMAVVVLWFVFQGGTNTGADTSMKSAPDSPLDTVADTKAKVVSNSRTLDGWSHGPDLDDYRAVLRRYVASNTADLRSLKFFAPRATDEDLKLLSNLKAKRVMIDLSGTLVTDDGLLHLKSLDLDILRLDYTKVASLKNIGWFKTLSVLSLNSTDVDDKSLANLKGLTGLHELQLMRTRVSTSAVWNLVAELPSVVTVRVDHCKAISSKDIVNLERAYPLCSFCEDNRPLYYRLQSEVSMHRDSGREDLADLKAMELCRLMPALRNHPVEIIFALRQRGATLAGLRQYEAAQKYLLQSANLSLQHQDDIHANVLADSVNALVDVARYAHNFRQSEKIADEWAPRIVGRYGKDSGEIALLYRRKADALRLDGHKDEALQLYKASLKILDTIRDFPKEQADINSHIAVFLMQTEPEAAIAYLKRSIALSDSKDSASFLLRIGQIYLRTGKFESALEYGRKSLSVAERLNQLKSRADAYVLIGNACVALDDNLTEAKVSYETSTAIYEQITPRNVRQLADQYRSLGEVYSKLKDWKAAQATYKKSYEAILGIENGPVHEQQLTLYRQSVAKHLKG